MGLLYMWAVYIISSKIAGSVIKSIKDNNFETFQINGVIIVDKDMTGEIIEGILVVSDVENAAEFLHQ